ncbi:MAG: helix-turn-helix transcriptional regulator [Gammaproteobacteria bacterium]|nr:helix-turn-helix transcriptional regulator [Gammaproteobacteria bacterium]
MLDTEMLGARIAKARIAKGLTEQQLAHRLGVKVAAVEKWESGETDPRANRLDQLAGMLGVPLMWLIGGGDAPPDVESPTFTETHGVEEKLLRAEELVKQLSMLLVDLGRDVRRLQRNIDFDKSS